MVALATTGGVAEATPVLMSVPPATEMFQFAGFASRPYQFRSRYLLGRWVAPFGDPGIADRSHLPRAFRSVPRPSSPLSAKASTRCPSSALDHRRFRQKAPQHRRAQGQDPHDAKRPHMKTLLRTHPALWRRACPPRSHDKLSLHPSINTPAPGCPAAVSRVIFSERHRIPKPHRNLIPEPHRRSRRLAGGVAAVVEVNGIEPMTSCLQSRRSPN